MLSKLLFFTTMVGVCMMCFSSFLRAVEPRGINHGHEVIHKLHGNGGAKKSIVIK